MQVKSTKSNKVLLNVHVDHVFVGFFIMFYVFLFMLNCSCTSEGNKSQVNLHFIVIFVFSFFNIHIIIYTTVTARR